MAERSVALLDANVLIALAWPSHVHHARAHRWLTTWDGEWATTPLTETAFVRLSMNTHVVHPAVTAAQALTVVQSLRAHPDHHFVTDDTALCNPLVDLASLAGHSQVTDFHLVNLCAHHGAVLATLDARLPAALRAADRHHVVLLPA